MVVKMQYKNSLRKIIEGKNQEPRFSATTQSKE
jgi:hypothetical protein